MSLDLSNTLVDRNMPWHANIDDLVNQLAHSAKAIAQSNLDPAQQLGPLESRDMQRAVFAAGLVGAAGNDPASATLILQIANQINAPKLTRWVHITDIVRATHYRI